MLNLVVWNKTNAGQGSFYRSQDELIGVFRVGAAPHRNNIELGRFGRNRSNVWTYPGVNTFTRGRMEALAAHPTIKPVALVADALLDCTAKGEAVLDRPKGPKTVGAVLRDVTQRRIEVTENGKTRRILVLEVMLRRLANDAMRSDPRAMKTSALPHRPIRRISRGCASSRRDAGRGP
jgi:hypothetical protein